MSPSDKARSYVVMLLAGKAAERILAERWIAESEAAGRGEFVRLRPRDHLYRTAYHEAAHGVVGMLNGEQLDLLSVGVSAVYGPVPHRFTQGRAGVAQFGAGSGEPLEQRVKDSAAVAGERDQRTALRYLYILEGRGSWLALKPLFRAYQKRALEVVREQWGLVETVAERLYVERSLSGGQVAEIAFGRAWKPAVM